MYGLAGTRVGYAMAGKEFILPVQTVREVFAVNRIAHAGAMAALDDEEYKEFVLKMNREEMGKLKSKLEHLGFVVYPSHANFLFVNMKRDSSQIFQELIKQGLIIRPCNSWGLDTFARITIGTPEQNVKLIDALKKLFRDLTLH
jgi:histidinol-phosphate aminotransferase